MRSGGNPPPPRAGHDRPTLVPGLRQATPRGQDPGSGARQYGLPPPRPPAPVPARPALFLVQLGPRSRPGLPRRPAHRPDWRQLQALRWLGRSPRAERRTTPQPVPPGRSPRTRPGPASLPARHAVQARLKSSASSAGPRTRPGRRSAGRAQAGVQRVGLRSGVVVRWDSCHWSPPVIGRYDLRLF